MSSFLVKSVSLTKSTDIFALLKVLLWAQPMHETPTLVLLASNSKALMDCIDTFPLIKASLKSLLTLSSYFKLLVNSSWIHMDSQGS
jgi:hypothetical protein